MTTKDHLARALGALKDLFALIGIAALAAVVVLPMRQAPMASEEARAAEAAVAPTPQPPAAVELAAAEAAAPIQAPAPAQPAAPVQAEPLQTAAIDMLEPEQQAITSFISRRYRIAERAVAHFVSTAYRAGAQYSIDPLLILAVMAVESGYNPVAKSVVGAKGLMQVLPRFHLEKLADHGGEPALLEPEVNIFVGTRILREYLDRFRDVETALQMYVGSLDNPTSQYAKKVLAERARIEAALRRALGKRQSA